VLNVVDETVTGGLRTDEGATPCATLAGKNTLPTVAGSPVCAKEVSDLTTTDADVARGNVCVGTCCLRKWMIIGKSTPLRISAGAPNDLDKIRLETARSSLLVAVPNCQIRGMRDR
jgi:hypothetical protein